MIRYVLCLMLGIFWLHSATAQTRQRQDPATVLVKDEFYENKTLTFILSDLERKYPVSFQYDAGQIGSQKLFYWFNTKTLTEGLKEAFKKTDLDFSVSADFVVHVGLKNQQMAQKANTHFAGQPNRRNFNLTGRVTDRATGETLPFATLQIPNTKISAQTNVDGRFTLLSVPSDTVTIMVSYVGYKAQRYQGDCIKR
ncbi:MAG: carboxypeptidase-like regulatory domain-containing protein [Cytophagales bacterium]|nr:MAG: carboxypeptidase-like regulatory domain-containing protein [Cytophagales bacterium]